jgi:hypothetical protein
MRRAGVDHQQGDVAGIRLEGHRRNCDVTNVDQ